MLPPVADQVTVTLEVLLSDMRPMAENCCAPPGRQVHGRGRDLDRTRVGAAGVIVTVEVSAFVPPCCVAITRNVPAVVPAV